MVAANVVRSPSCEKLLWYQYGSSVVSPATQTPETMKNGSSEASVFAFIIRACTKVMYPNMPETVAQMAAM